MCSGLSSLAMLRVSHESQRFIVCASSTQGWPGRTGKAWPICLSQLFLCRVRLSPWPAVTGEREADHVPLVSSRVKRESVGVYELNSAFLILPLSPAERCVLPHGHSLELLLSVLPCPLYWQLVFCIFIFLFLRLP